LKVVFTDASTGSITSRSWAYKLNTATTWTTIALAGDNSFTFATPGTYDVRLTVAGPGGSDDETKTAYITVNPAPVAPVASFSATPTKGTSPLTVAFTDASTGTGPLTYAWDFGDGMTSTEQNPSHTFTVAGRFTVKLTVTSAVGSTTATRRNYITVNRPPAPVPAFVASATTGTAPLAVQFTDRSTGSPTSWKWDFGDGTTSTEQNPSHTYTKAGQYTVKLTATNDGGSKTATYRKFITVTWNAATTAPIAELGADITSGTSPLTVRFTDRSTNAPLFWEWDFGDGTTSTEQHPVHVYSGAGRYNVTLTAINAGGMSTTKNLIVVTRDRTTG
jgi:PKD repeat protein